MPHPVRAMRRGFSRLNRAINPISLRRELRDIREFWDDAQQRESNVRSEVRALQRQLGREIDIKQQRDRSAYQAHRAGEMFAKWLEFDEALMRFLESDPDTYLRSEVNMWPVAQMRQRMATMASGYAQTRSDMTIGRY